MALEHQHLAWPSASCAVIHRRSSRTLSIRHHDRQSTENLQIPCRRFSVASALAVVYNITMRAIKLIGIADTPEAIARGLQNVGSLEFGTGLLFIHPHTQVLSYWMRDTLIPLDIAFIREDGVVASVATMEPLSDAPVSSGEPCRAALEVSAGLLALLGVAPGSQAMLPQDRSWIAFA